MKRFYCYLSFLLLLLSNPSFAQDDDVATTRPLVAATLLLYNGRFNEAQPIIDRMVDSLKMLVGKQPDKDDLYFQLLAMQASIYQNKGDYSQAEQLLKRVLTAADNNVNKSRNHALSNLVRFYEKTGNDNSLQESLEELVLLEYGNEKMLDEKELFFRRYTKIMASLDTSKDKDQLSYYQLLALGAESEEDTASIPASEPDSVKVQRIVNYLWESFTAAKSDPDVDQRALSMAFPVRFMVDEDLPDQATSQALKSLLRQGKLKIATPRMGLSISDPWSEVKKLFLVYKKKGNYVAAEALMRQAISADERLPGEGSASGLNDFMKSLFTPELMDSMGDAMDPKLKDNLLQMTSLNNKHGNVDIAYIQNKTMLAGLYRETGREADYRQLADTIYLLCKRMDSVVNPMLTNAIAAVYMEIGREREALLLYQKLVQYFKTNSGENYISAQFYQDALQQMTRIYKSAGKYKEAGSTIGEALAYDKKVGMEGFPDHFHRLTETAELYETMNQPALAAQYCSMVLGPLMNNIRENFSFLSEGEKISFLNNQTAAFDLSASLIVTDKHPAATFIMDAYNHQLALKGLVLSDEKKIYSHIHSEGTPALKQLLEKWQDTRSAIAWQYSQPPSSRISYVIDSLNHIANDQEKALSQLSHDFIRNRESRQTNFQDIQRQLKPGAAAIEFIRFKYYHQDWTDTVRYAAFVTLADHNAPYFVPLCAERDIEEVLGGTAQQTKQFIDGLYGNGLNPGDNTTSGRRSDRLYQLIWAPLEQHLKDIHEVSVSPAGLLCRINFGALPYDQQHYLIDQYDIREYNSIRQLAEGKTDSIRSTDAVLFGNIDYGVVNTGKRWVSLPGTGTEVQQVGRLLKASRCDTTIFTGALATEERFKQLSGHSPQVLHVATHGFSKPLTLLSDNPLLPADNPMLRTGIVMAGANLVWSGGQPVEGKEDGIVTAYEIAGLDLSNSRLVVLSACETALGDIRDSEGVFGLQRAFKLAGAGDLLLGLWSLPDNETTQLMSSFYRYKTGTERYSNSTAFHKAQKELRSRLSPYHWAGMILIE